MKRDGAITSFESDLKRITKKTLTEVIKDCYKNSDFTSLSDISPSSVLMINCKYLKDDDFLEIVNSLAFTEIEALKKFLVEKDFELKIGERLNFVCRKLMKHVPGCMISVTSDQKLDSNNPNTKSL